MAKKVKAPKGAELKLESQTKLQINQLKQEFGYTKTTPGVGAKAALNGIKVKRAFKLGKNSKSDKRIL